MRKFNSKNIILCLLMIFSVLLVAVSGVCAQDINTTDNITDLNNNDIKKNHIINDENKTSENQNAKKLSATGTFDDLQVEINKAHEGSVLNLTRDYNGCYGSRIHLDKDLTINGRNHTINCLNTEYGAFYLGNGKITLMNLKIINGHNGDGGVIYINGFAQYTIINCTFYDNCASGWGGVIYNNKNKPLTIINCSFNNNYAKESGGAIYSQGEVHIENSIFKSNTASEGGGAIHALYADIINSIFEENTAFYAGAIYNNDGCVKNCIFKNNKADGSGIDNCRGGAIVNAGDIIVDNSTFIGNYAYDYGGAIYTYGHISISSSIFRKNYAKDNDGGAVVTLKFADIMNSIFDSNHADVDGGAIYCIKTLSVKNTLFKNNWANGAYSDCYCGAIRSEKDVKVDNSTFIGNHAADYGGAIYANEYISVYSSYFENNYVKDNSGGAIYAEASVDIVDSIFDSNQAWVDAGAVYSKNSVSVKNATFKNNKAASSTVSQCYGGAIRSKENVKIDNSTFDNNHAGDYGGAIYADTITWVDSPSYFIDNYVDDNCGGAIYTNKFETDVKYGVFINNQAKNNDDGGAIYINKENWITFSQCVFVNNHCGDEGGAIYLDSSSSHLTLVNNIFVSNSAKDGQAVYNCGVFDSINNNWWGGNNPSSDNDQLIEWKAWPRSNIHHSDENPLKLVLELSENTCKVNSLVCATAGFYNNDGSLYSGEMSTDYISFMPTSDIEFSNRTVDKVYVTTLVSPQKEGQYNITATLFGQLVSDVLTVNGFQYSPENASTSRDMVILLPNEPYEGFIDSLNMPVNNAYNVALNSNNENASWLGVNSKINGYYTNSLNETSNNGRVAKTIDN